MKNILITGSSSGLGLSIAKEFLNNGFKVVGVSRGRPQISNKLFKWLSFDLSDFDNLKKINDKIKIKNLDILVNCAGVAIYDNPVDFDRKSFQKNFEVNFQGPIYLFHALQDKLKRATVINILSDVTRFPVKNLGFYIASKLSLEVYFKSTICEVFKNLKVINIMPSMINTALLKEMLRDSFENWSEILQPDEIAKYIYRVWRQRNKFKNNDAIFITNDWLNRRVQDFQFNSWVFNISKNKLKKVK